MRQQQYTLQRILAGLYTGLHNHDYRTLTLWSRRLLRPLTPRADQVTVRPYRRKWDYNVPPNFAAACKNGEEVVICRRFWRGVQEWANGTWYGVFLLLHELGHVVAAETQATANYNTDRLARDASEFFAEFFALCIWRLAGRPLTHPLHTTYLGHYGPIMAQLQTAYREVCHAN